MTLENYPLLKKGTYLNTAYMGLMSMSLSNYRRDYEKRYLNEGDSLEFEISDSEGKGPSAINLKKIF